MSSDFASFIFLVSGPSGVGKSTLLSALIKRHNELHVSVSHTTRKSRNNEIEGKDYFFTSKQTFLNSIENNDFIEYAVVHGHYYGTSRQYVEKALDSGFNLLLDIDVQGFAQVRNSFPASSLVSVFVLPPGMADLEERLRFRGTESEEAIVRRMKNATEELKVALSYDYLVFNIDVYEAVERLSSIYIEN